MDMNIKLRFMEKWKNYFPAGDLPIACYYTDETKDSNLSRMPEPDQNGYNCIFRQLDDVRQGIPRAFYARNLGCAGARLNLGFDSKGAVSEVENILANVERYKKSRGHVKAWYKRYPPLKAPGKFIVFKRWDMLDKEDIPQVVSFFAPPDTIAGLHTLANFNTMADQGVIAPFGSGCDTLVVFPFRELYAESPKAVLSGFDPSCRQFGDPDKLIFSIPWPKFMEMLENMDDSFLITEIWENIKSRCNPS